MLEYLLISVEGNLPEIDHLRPFKAVLVAECAVTQDRQYQISKWLVDSGCLYMMACGKNCSSWDDSVDSANLEKFNYRDIPDSELVVTTWHEHEPLQEVFWFAKNTAFHPQVNLENTLIVHIGDHDKSEQYLASYTNA